MVEKNLLFVVAKAPHGSLHLQEYLDMVLTAAAFEQKVGLLFVEDGVHLLAGGQQPDRIGARDVAAVLQSLPLYGVEQVFVERDSVDERAVDIALDGISVQLVERCRVGAVMAGFDAVVTC